MQASSTKVIYLHKQYNQYTSDRIKIVKFFEQLKDSVELVYGYKKNNPLLKDMHVFPQEMKIIVGYFTYKIIYKEERAWGMENGWNLEYKCFALNNVVGEVTYAGMYYILDYLLEDVAEKVQEGLNELPEKLPYYSTTSRKQLY